MSPKEERAYTQGKRMALTRILSTIVQDLGYDTAEAKQASWIAEREAAISILRSVCGDHGDNDWSDNLHLADIIDKHLARHL
jgi:hypothetical protein